MGRAGWVCGDGQGGLEERSKTYRSHLQHVNTLHPSNDTTTITTSAERPLRIDALLPDTDRNPRACDALKGRFGQDLV